MATVALDWASLDEKECRKSRRGAARLFSRAIPQDAPLSRPVDTALGAISSAPQHWRAATAVRSRKQHHRLGVTLASAHRLQNRGPGSAWRQAARRKEGDGGERAVDCGAQDSVPSAPFLSLQDSNAPR